jgi:hypothetical protein
LYYQLNRGKSHQPLKLIRICSKYQ